ncbi:hypothetical protein QFZ55_001890 [Streptomyces luteogriseus]|uniref:sterol desaturase family protein n=1 Tax=Streptomyces luteogriseus TaxID=68233 RepID=UPI002788867A|nr:sterol desaturase family protein [Streptomyces luteogriseus]MDQ0712438.1 hypothetical protein [Streptomyces luteogriseus]
MPNLPDVVLWPIPAFVLLAVVEMVSYRLHPDEDAEGYEAKDAATSVGIDRMPRWFEFVFNTPSHHRVHHASQGGYLDRNFGGILIVWDRVFGSFVAETEQPRYGLTKNIDTYNLLKVATHEYVSIAKDLRAARGWRERAGRVFRGPGWGPAAVPALSPAAVPAPSPAPPGPVAETAPAAKSASV